LPCSPCSRSRAPAGPNCPARFISLNAKPAIRRLHAITGPALAFCLLAGPADATDIEPRAYANIPVGLNFLVVNYAYTQGNVSFAPTVPITNGRMSIHSAILAYVRSLDLWGRSGKLDIIVPQAWLSGQAEVLGKPRTRDISGFADPWVRFYVNLLGAPAMSMKDFSQYQQDLILGASLSVSPPGGQYDPEKLVNLGTNRWTVKPELGLSKAFGPLTAELAAGVFIFTDNDQPFRGKTLEQDPMVALQSHLIYSFGHGVWAAFDANYYTGGQTTKDGVEANDRMENWRLGGTLSFPLSRQQSIKLFGSSGIYARTGSNFDIVGLAWQYRWGEGL
jgi:hypothetical protein